MSFQLEDRLYCREEDEAGTVVRRHCLTVVLELPAGAAQMPGDYVGRLVGVELPASLQNGPDGHRSASRRYPENEGWDLAEDIGE